MGDRSAGSRRMQSNSEAPFWRVREEVQNCASNPGTQLLQSGIGFMIGSKEAVSGEELIDGVFLRVLLEIGAGSHMPRNKT